MGGGTFATADNSVTLNCKTTGADPAVDNYAWFQGTTNLNTATTTYTFTPTSTNNGNMYKCQAKNGGVTTDSPDYTLNVYSE